MNSLPKSAPLDALGLESDHWVRFHVEGDTIAFEVAASVQGKEAPKPSRKPTGFVQKWGGSARKIEDTTDPWLTHINEKHMR